jgi:hypothetical protein
MLNTIKDYYEKLYTSKKTDEISSKEYIFDTKLDKILNDKEKLDCDGEVTSLIVLSISPCSLITLLFSSSNLLIDFLTCLCFSKPKKYELFCSPNSTHFSLDLMCADEISSKKYIFDTKLDKILNDKEKLDCDGEVTDTECSEAIGNMKLNKSYICLHSL